MRQSEYAAESLKALMRYWWSIGLGAWFKYSRPAYVFWFFCKDFYSKNSIDFWIYSKKFKSNQPIVTKGQPLKIVQHWCHQFDDGFFLVTRFEMFVIGRCHQYFGTNNIVTKITTKIFWAVKKKRFKKIMRSDQFEKLGGKEEPRRRSRKIKTHVRISSSFWFVDAQSQSDKPFEKPIRAQFGWPWTWERSYTINLKSERTKSISVDESDENQLWNNPSSSRSGMSHASITHKEDSYMGHRKEKISCKRSLVASDRLRCNNLKIQWNNLQ